jgi:hypothetical protein
MDEQKQAEVVTIKEAADKVKSWIAAKDFEKAKQGCEEILAVEKDNAEIKALLDQANAGLEGKPEPALKEETTDKVKEVVPQETPKEEAPAPAVQTPDMIMKPKEEAKPEVKEEKPKKEDAKPMVKKHFPIGKLILIILMIAIAGGLVFTYIQGWLNPAFEWVLELLGL